jgi:hypothetical protein
MGQVFSEYFGFLCQFSLHRLLYIHYYLSSGAGTIGEIVVDVTSGLSLTTSLELKKKRNLTTTNNMVKYFASLLTFGIAYPGLGVRNFR